MNTQIHFRKSLTSGVLTIVIMGSACNLSQQSEEQPVDVLNAERVEVGCDPDGLAPCPDDWFLCVENNDGEKLCFGQEPSTPDDGHWECSEEDGTLVCRGSSLPEDSGEWECFVDDQDIVCQRETYVPIGGDDSIWDCWYEGEFIVCESSTEDSVEEALPIDETEQSSPSTPVGEEGLDGCPPGIEMPSAEVCGDGIDNDCDGITDEDCEESSPDEEPGEVDEGVCICLPGSWRYCDLGRWGIQYCEDDGLAWGPCTPTSAPVVCIEYFCEACCIENDLCCVDSWDLDGDGDTNETVGDCPVAEC